MLEKEASHDPKQVYPQPKPHQGSRRAGVGVCNLLKATRDMIKE